MCAMLAVLQKRYCLFEGFCSSVLTQKTFRKILSCYCTRGQRSTTTLRRFPGRLLYAHKYGTRYSIATLHCCRHRATERGLSIPAPIATDPSPAAPTCSGCGSVLQSQDPLRQGYITLQKLQQGVARSLEDSRGDGVREETEDEAVAAGERGRPSTQLTCKRCFSLKHYNTALNVTLQAQDYLRHLSHLRDKRALILLVVDVVDFPGSLFPDLHTLTSPASRVLVVANKIDLLPRDVDGNFWNRVRASILDECKTSSLRGCSVAGLVFTSVKSGEGLENLTTFVVEYWGNRGDVYLLGCTNVGKSSLFNPLLQTLCGASPGQLAEDCGVGVPPPAATISHWPGTTLGLLSFPIMSVGKRKRLVAQALTTRESGTERGGKEPFTDCDISGPKKPETEEVKNRFWLHDTPGAINEEQLINLLTTKELNLALPKKPLKPRTFLLKPRQCLLLGGLARLDYIDGAVSAYFTVFAAPYLPVHVTRMDKADSVWAKNLGTPLLKIPFGDSERLTRFPELKPQLVSVTGTGWSSSAADVVLSSAGWVAVIIARDKEVCLMAHTPAGHGVHCRQPSLWPYAVTKRGKRFKKHNSRATFTRK